MFSDLAGCMSPQQVTIEGPEARHLAKVKRARTGETVGLLDGQARLGAGTITEIAGSNQRPTVTIALERIETIEPTKPSIQICCPAPKGDRLERMIDQLTQIGVASWTPLITDRSERDPKAIRQDRIDRIINEALKQCIRTTALAVHEPMTLTQAIDQNDAIQIIVCDGSGDSSLAPVEADHTRILIGPEGGWSDQERSTIQESNIPIRRLGVHVMRLETAAVVAASLALANAHTPGTQES